MVTPIDGLPSTPTRTISSPCWTRASIAPATAVASRWQCRRNAAVSYCSRTAQNRFSPAKASSGQGICSIRQPRARSTSTIGE